MKNIKKSLITAGFLLLITGCGTTSGVGYAWFGTSVEEGWESGGRIRSHFSTHTEANVRQAANGYCATRGLLEPTITYTQRVGEYSEYSFTCQKPDVRPVQQPIFQPPALRIVQPEVIQNNNPIEKSIDSTQLPEKVGNKLSIDVAKIKCAELGFKPATEGFGKCVLQLSK